MVEELCVHLVFAPCVSVRVRVSREASDLPRGFWPETSGDESSSYKVEYERGFFLKMLSFQSSGLFCFSCSFIRLG